MNDNLPPDSTHDTPHQPSNVVSFMKAKEGATAPAVKKAKTYEVHLYSSEFYPENHPGEVILTTGFLKFGPQFIAVVEESEDIPVPTIVFTIATPSVKYIKAVDEDGSIQSTLSL